MAEDSSIAQINPRNIHDRIAIVACVKAVLAFSETIGEIATHATSSIGGVLHGRLVTV